jgi:hypothetical protein
MTRPDDMLKRRVLEAVRQHPVPRRIDRRPALVTLTALAAVAMGAAMQWGPRLFGEPGGIEHAAGRPTSSGAWILGGTLAIALVATWIVLPLRSMLAPGRGVLLGVTLGVPLLIGAWLVLWHSTYDDPFTRVGFRCLALTLMTAPWPFVALAYASARAEPRHPGLTGAALGAVAGSWAAFMVELWCPLAVANHVLVGHVLPLAVLAIAGAALGRSLFRVRWSAGRPVPTSI